MGPAQRARTRGRAPAEHALAGPADPVEGGVACTCTHTHTRTRTHTHTHTNTKRRNRTSEIEPGDGGVNGEGVMEGVEGPGTSRGRAGIVLGEI